MFDVTADEIENLSDVELRELVARLCEAELTSRGLSSVYVTWGGNQDAADGGLDVRVELPVGTTIDGFIPRHSTGFQVKLPDMPAAKIWHEMRPGNIIRPVIQQLADEKGGYIIVSSKGFLSDAKLKNRRIAIRESLVGVANSDQLHTDFYDRRRLATWVGRHPGLITWVKRKLGRGLSGWQPYGPWSRTEGGVEDEYLLDDKLRLHLGRESDALLRPVTEAIDDLREELAQPGKVLRLIGLSGVGKTRFVQALFDARVGTRALDRSLAVYTDLSHDPNPQPMGLATDLLENRMRAVLIIDNCTPELHHDLAKLCSASGSTLSVITVEYDVRKDQPERTRVVRLETSSLDLIERLVLKRYPYLSTVDGHTIARVSDGNARVAMAIAGTVQRSETISGLSDEELFNRLFRQRHANDTDLLQAAQVFSLVYSFEGATLDGADAELPQLAVLADQTPRQLLRHIAELMRRDLVQKRSVWRALLPHAVANKLAARALQDIPFDLIDQQIGEGGSDRLARSFSRRLAYLHDSPEAIAIVRRWFSVDGMLGDATALNKLGQAIFVNVAPVDPEMALIALERVGNQNPEAATEVWENFRYLLHSLAYDASLFERSASLLARAIALRGSDQNKKDLTYTFCAMFTLYLSGTHASLGQRLDLIERLLRSDIRSDRSLGLAALDAMLGASSFNSGHEFAFGGRSRDFGYTPQTRRDVVRWYRAALSLIDRLANTEGLLRSELSDLVAQKFRDLWTSVHMFGAVIFLSRRFAAHGFWREGWLACRGTINLDKGQLGHRNLVRLRALEAELRPSTLGDRVRAVVLGNGVAGFGVEETEFENDYAGAFERLETMAEELGETVAVDEAAVDEILPEVLRSSGHAYRFGLGLSRSSADTKNLWQKIIKEFLNLSEEKRNFQLLRGYIAGLDSRNKVILQDILDLSLDDPGLLQIFPLLQSAATIDRRGFARLKHAFRSDDVPVWTCGFFKYGGLASQFTGNQLSELLQILANRSDGFDVALDILHMRFLSDQSEKRAHEAELLETGRHFLSRLQFRRNGQQADYKLAKIAKVCLTGEAGLALAREIAVRLRQSVVERLTYDHDNHELFKVILGAHSEIVLDALFEGNSRAQRAAVGILQDRTNHRPNPADSITDQDLIAWCDRSPEERYPLAASFVTFSHRIGDGPLKWTNMAKVILTAAPDSLKVLANFVDRFRRTNWSGSLAALMEADASLLDCLPDGLSAEGLDAFVAETKERLAREIARRWEEETEREQRDNERFE